MTVFGYKGVTLVHAPSKCFRFLLWLLLVAPNHHFINNTITEFAQGKFFGVKIRLVRSRIKVLIFKGTVNIPINTEGGVIPMIVFWIGIYTSSGFP